MPRARYYIPALALFSSLLGPVAHAAEAMVMVNLNYSSEELAAARAVASKRGQEFVVVPPEELIPYAEPLFKLRLKLEANVKRLRPNLNKSEVSAIVNDFSRRGGASDKDRALTEALIGDVEASYRATADLAKYEARLGSIEAQIKAKAAALRTRGVRVDSLVLSGHSDGANLTGESTVRLSAGEIDRLRGQEPQLFKAPRHVLLLGCYNLTETNRERWRNDVFPNASLIAGFGVQAPSRWRENAIKYIPQVLNAADELDDKMIAQNSPLSAELITNTLRKLSAVTGTQAVIDYCLNIVEGQPGTGRISCEEQWKSAMHQAELITKEYIDLETAQSEPPDESESGVLRTFYTNLQNTCPAVKNPAIPDNEKWAAEKYKQEKIASVIRLIKWANVQRNFQTYYAKDIGEITDYLAHLGINGRLPELDGTAKRLDFTREYRRVELDISKALSSIQYEMDRLRSGSGSYSRRRELDYRRTGLLAMRERFQRVYRPLYWLRGESSVGLSDGASEQAVLAKGGVPFNWIEPATVLRPRETE